MKILICVFSFILIFSPNSQGEDYKIHNLSQQVVALSKLPKSLSESEKISYWVKHLEPIAPIYFNQVYSGNKNEFILDAFQINQSVSEEKIKNVYALYDKIIRETIKKYEARVPDYNSNIDIILAPGISWGGSYIHSDKGDFLTLGMDLYLDRPDAVKNKLNQLITHEFFHHYHAQLRKSNITEELYLSKGKLFWQLWDEGMAIWGTGYVANNQDYVYAMLGNYDDYIPCENDPRLAELFLTEINNPAIDLETPINFKKWFGAKDTSLLGENIPVAYGYYLGWRVINQISKTTPREEFMSWHYDQAKPHIIEQLKSIASGENCSNVPG